MSAPSRMILAAYRHIRRRTWLAVALLAGLLILFVPVYPTSAAPAERSIRIEAGAFQFSPSEIAINPGDRVTVDLISTDVVHGFSLDGYELTLTAQPGQPATGTFVAGRPGVFRFRCSVPCGNLHPFMSGVLRVGPDLLFGRAVLLAVLAVVAGVWSLKSQVPA